MAARSFQDVAVISYNRSSERDARTAQVPAVSLHTIAIALEQLDQRTDAVDALATPKRSAVMGYYRVAGFEFEANATVILI